MFRKGLLVVVSAPSGTGKGTLLQMLRKVNKNVRFSISVTTRPPRQGEEDGKDYFFRTVEQFEDMVKNGELIEWVKYCDNYYGTPKKFVEDAIDQGFDIVLEIDVEGAMNIKKMFPESVMIFIVPPSLEELKKRIVGRGTEQTDVINKRIQIAEKELEYAEKYDYIVINDDIENAVAAVNSILTAEKHKASRNSGMLDEMGLLSHR